ncbi:PPE-repeat protein [Burkholderia aenigmatica]|uniref:PPE-repeat protein n=1 Tax=Burkholderia aenigmatica TaxID=2015348 RepID=A0A6J5IT67_9BURK|nr:MULTISPECIES: activator protein [Burkholderia]AYQ41445.1 activator protein [Burkholderia lata]MCA8293850.1 activator protein [Burkholderia sp. AU30198]UKD16413.1 activator protein [Burkholderia aenigmatica]CAB3962867.1 PPE-repeat protein [Burkholderia aenigmatica]VWC51758.1 PPE-repeat protein [Burkholderia aenigmatica]
MKIRQIASLVAAVVFTAISAAPAFAVTVSRADGQPMNPNGEPFSATGLTNLSKKAIVANCSVTFNGTITPAGIVNIASVQFNGGSLCRLVSASASSASPWTGQLDSATQLSINNAQVDFMVLGVCESSKLVAAWNDSNSSLAFNNADWTPDCRLTGTLMATPKLHVQ